ncbi:MAG: DUF1080 domain-containing protein [Bryobacteraceae bacterium]
MEPEVLMARPGWLLALGSLAVAAMGQTPEAEWKPLFDGKSLGHWKATPFPRQRGVRVEDGTIVLPAGQPLTGVTWQGEFPGSGYELRFEAVRRLGGDFFASVTLPAGGNYATWVLGGWGGDIVGISSIDNWDASDNETRSYYTFETDRWYSFRIRVTGSRIQAWIDGQRVVHVNIAGRAISLRPGDIGLSTPLGFASYNTTGGIRKIEYRPVSGD